MEANSETKRLALAPADSNGLPQVHCRVDAALRSEQLSLSTDVKPLRLIVMIIITIILVTMIILIVTIRKRIVIVIVTLLKIL